VFCRLGTFGGSFSLEAAQEVAGDGLDEWAFLDTLSGLIDKSLVVVVPTAGSNASQTLPRYALLQTMKDYSLELLERSGGVAAAMEPFCRWMDRWLCDTKSLPPERFDDAQKEQDNISKAIQWTTRNDLELAIRLAHNSGFHWKYSGQYAVGIKLFEDIAAAANFSKLPDSSKEKIYFRLCDMTFESHDFSRMPAFAETYYALAHRQNDPQILVWAAVWQGMAHRVGKKDLPRALEFAQEELAHALASGAKTNVAIAHVHIARTLNELGRFSEAVDELRVALVLSDEAGDNWGKGFAHCCLGIAHWGLRQTPESLVHWKRAYQFLAATGHTFFTLWSMHGWAAAQLADGDPEGAARLGQQSLLLGKERGGYVSVAAEALQILGHCLVKLDHPSQAAELFSAAENLDRRSSFSRFLTSTDEASEVAAVEALRQRFPVEDAWQRGQQLSPASAVDRAIELVDEVVGPVQDEHAMPH